MQLLVIEYNTNGIHKYFVEEDDSCMIPIWCNHDHCEGYEVVEILNAKEKVDRGFIA